MSDKLAFETAPYKKLCNCVTVELTPEQQRLMDAWPDRSPSIVKSAMLNNQQLHVDGECQHCNATGLIAEKAAYEPFVTMKGIKWTFEACLQDAKKFNRKSEWVRASKSAYYAAKSKGWFEACVEHMNKDNSSYTKDDLKTIASSYKSRHEWKLSNKETYCSAQRRGLLSAIANEVFGEPKIKSNRKVAWTVDSVIAEASKFQTRTDWAKANPASYEAARSKRILGICTSHMKNVIGNDYRVKIEQAASKFKSKGEWREGDVATYKLARKYGCIKYICAKLWAI